MFSFQGELQLTTSTVCNPTLPSSINPTAIRESSNREKNVCWVRIVFVKDICINRLIPLPTRFNFPSYRNTCQTVKMKPIVSAMNAWSWYAICYTALLFWKFCGLRCWPAILVIHTASSSRYLPSSSSQSLDHYTRFDSFPLRWPRFILLST